MERTGKVRISALAFWMRVTSILVVTWPWPLTGLYWMCSGWPLPMVVPPVKIPQLAFIKRPRQGLPEGEVSWPEGPARASRGAAETRARRERTATKDLHFGVGFGFLRVLKAIEGI
jgi:hypothetical protein